jgi:hypothetical protein
MFPSRVNQVCQGLRVDGAKMDPRVVRVDHQLPEFLQGQVVRVVRVVLKVGIMALMGHLVIVTKRAIVIQIPIPIPILTQILIQNREMIRVKCLELLRGHHVIPTQKIQHGHPEEEAVLAAAVVPVVAEERRLQLDAPLTVAVGAHSVGIKLIVNTADLYLQFWVVVLPWLDAV